MTTIAETKKACTRWTLFSFAWWPWSAFAIYRALSSLDKTCIILGCIPSWHRRESECFVSLTTLLRSKGSSTTMFHNINISKTIQIPGWGPHTPQIFPSCFLGVPFCRLPNLGYGSHEHIDLSWGTIYTSGRGVQAKLVSDFTTILLSCENMECIKCSTTQ